MKQPHRSPQCNSGHRRRQMRAHAPPLAATVFSSSAFLRRRQASRSFLPHLSITLPRNSMSTAAAASSSGKESRGDAYTTLSERVSVEREIKKSKFIAVAGAVGSERSALMFLSEVRDAKATHNCWAYKIGDQFRSNDDGEPSGTAGKPIYSAIVSSGLDRVMVVVIRYFGGIKLGTGGLIPMGVEVSFDLLGLLYHQLQSLHAEDIKQDYDTGKDGTTMVTFKVDFDRAESLEDSIRATCGHDLVFYKH
ncbi:IMPACT family member YvyE-like protein [Drosera capensis]